GPNGKQVETPFSVANAEGKCPEPTVALPTTTAPKATASTKPGETTVPGATTTPGGSAGATTTTETPLVNGGDFTTTVTMGKNCVKPGGIQTIKVQTIEQGIVTYAVGYANFSPGGGNTNAGTADIKGKYQDTFTVPLNTTLGKADVQVVVKASNKRKSFAGVHFDVKDKC
ncbi:MAG: hypothetical protein QOF60_566, partial [Actinomycetota bacterium]|nr:hypothetical protein [Actinomycetota bacterium]